jgi:hypothetical protein
MTVVFLSNGRDFFVMSLWTRDDLLMPMKKGWTTSLGDGQRDVLLASAAVDRCGGLDGTLISMQMAEASRVCRMVLLSCV